MEKTLNYPHQFSSGHPFPKGYKQYRVLQRMIENEGLTYTQIITLAYELSHGKGTFKIYNNRGYWSGPFMKRSSPDSFYGSKANGWITLLCHYRDKLYYPNMDGMKVFGKLKDKFDHVSIEMAKRIHIAKRKKLIFVNNKEKQDEVTKLSPLSFKNVSSGSQESFKGLKLDDEVIYFRTYNNELGEGYIQSTIIHSKKIANNDTFSIGKTNSTIPQISYNKKDGKFYEMGGNEIIITKK